MDILLYLKYFDKVYAIYEIWCIYYVLKNLIRYCVGIIFLIFSFNSFLKHCTRFLIRWYYFNVRKFRIHRQFFIFLIRIWILNVGKIGQKLLKYFCSKLEDLVQYIIQDFICDQQNIFTGKSQKKKIVRNLNLNSKLQRNNKIIIFT